MSTAPLDQANNGTSNPHPFQPDDEANYTGNEYHPANHPTTDDGNILDRFYETVDAPCRVACQGSIEHQLDLLMVSVPYHTVDGASWTHEWGAFNEEMIHVGCALCLLFWYLYHLISRAFEFISLSPSLYCLGTVS